MARIAFDEKLQKYYQNTMYMGTMTEEYLVACIDVFSKNDIEHAKTLIAEDKKIDKMDTKADARYEASRGNNPTVASYPGDSKGFKNEIKVIPRRRKGKDMDGKES